MVTQFGRDPTLQVGSRGFKSPPLHYNCFLVNNMGRENKNINEKFWIPESIETEETAMNFIRQAIPLFFEGGGFEFISVFRFGELLHSIQQLRHGAATTYSLEELLEDEL